MAKVATIKNEVFAFEVWVKSVPQYRKTINHRTAGKAKADFLIDLNESWPAYKYTDLSVRKIGPVVTSVGFERNAEYRGMSGIKCGDRITACGATGVIVGHDSGACFTVLFDEDSPKYAGQIMSVHPGEIKEQPCNGQS